MCLCFCPRIHKHPLQIADPAKLDAIFVPIGGGGLIAGIAAYVKALHPHIQVTRAPTGFRVQFQAYFWGSSGAEPGWHASPVARQSATGSCCHMLTRAFLVHTVLTQWPVGIPFFSKRQTHAYPGCYYMLQTVKYLLPSVVPVWLLLPVAAYVLARR